MNGLHTVEAAWRQCRAGRPSGEILRTCLKYRESYSKFISLTTLPAEVALPVGIPTTLFEDGAFPIPPDLLNNNVARSAMINTFHVWAAYREAKTIYEVEESLTECLSRTPWPDRTPIEALRLQSICPVLMLPENGKITAIAVTYDLIGGGPNEGPPSLGLRLSRLDPPLWLPFEFFHLVGPDLEACFRAGRNLMVDVDRLDNREQDSAHREVVAKLALTVLLYLAGNPDVVRVIHAGQKPAIKESLRSREPERYKDLRDPVVHAVGKSFTRAIERWEIEHASQDTGLTGRTVRSHMRRAHAHLYWTGEGRKSPRVRFLLPVSVKGGKLVEEPDSPRVMAVR